MSKPTETRPQADDATLERCIESIPAIMADRPQSRLVWPIKRREK